MTEAFCWFFGAAGVMGFAKRFFENGRPERLAFQARWRRAGGLAR